MSDTPPSTQPLVLVEDTGGESVFVAVWEPFRGRPLISKISRLEFRGVGGRAFGLTVEAGARTDHILIDPEGAETRTVEGAGITFQGKFGLVSEVKGKPLFKRLICGSVLSKESESRK